MEQLWVEVNSRTNFPIKLALVQMKNEGVVDMEDEVPKYCATWITTQVVEVGLQYAVSLWNSNAIPGNLKKIVLYGTQGRAERVKIVNKIVKENKNDASIWIHIMFDFGTGARRTFPYNMYVLCKLYVSIEQLFPLPKSDNTSPPCLLSSSALKRILNYHWKHD